MQIEGSGVIVTGGASGLGLATASAFRDAGANVGIIDRAGAGGWNGPVAKADISSEDEVRNAFVTLKPQIGQLRCIVNCAAMGGAGISVGDDATLTVELFRKTLLVNTLGSFIITKLAAEDMRHAPPDEDGQRGVCILVSSIVAMEGQVGTSSYAASKGGVNAMILPLAREFAGFGVRVMGIAPGIFETPMFQGGPPAMVSWLREQVQFPKRTGRPSEFAAMARHIFENPMLNGEVIRLDGAYRVPPGTTTMRKR